MTRVIAGTAGGRRLRVPDGRRVRPTADRIKEALFSSLGDLRDLVVLDLFAGTGGLAIEALSRGAARAVLVDSDRRSIAAIRDNLRTADVADRAEVVSGTAAQFARTPVGGPFDLVLLDPPYDLPLPEVEALLADLLAADVLRPGARVVLERDRHVPEPTPRMLSHDSDRTYGETVLRYLTVPDGPSADLVDRPGGTEVRR